MIIQGQVNVFLEPNTDTDIIIPARFLKRTSLDGFETFAFFEKRYDLETICEPNIKKKDYEFKKKKLNPQCSLNNPHSEKATFLVTWLNFGCGSSREHAVYALSNYKVIIGSALKNKNAFADIFRDNCRQNLIWTPVLKEEDHQQLVNYLTSQLKNNPVTLCLNLEQNKLFDQEQEFSFPFEIPTNHKDYILNAISDDPFEIAKKGIEEQLTEINQWIKNEDKIISKYPKAI